MSVILLCLSLKGGTLKMLQMLPALVMKGFVADRSRFGEVPIKCNVKLAREALPDLRRRCHG